MCVEGFKAFNNDMTNRYGMKFETGKIYLSKDSIVKFRNGGFHLCKNFEDTLRYFDAFNEQINICSVLGFGNTDIYNDEYYGYYDMYAVQKLYIIKMLSRDEILQMAKELSEFRLERFVSLYKLSKEEIEFLKPYPTTVFDAIEFYQYGNQKVYERSDNSGKNNS